MPNFSRLAIFGFDPAPFDRQRPVAHHLAGRGGGSQAQPLQPARDRDPEAIAGDMVDREAHGGPSPIP